MTLLVDEELALSTDEISKETVPEQLKTKRRRCRKSIIVSIMSAAVSMVTFLAFVGVLVYVRNVFKTSLEDHWKLPHNTPAYSRNESFHGNFPVAYMVLDTTSLSDGHEFLRWKNYKNQTYTKGGLTYSSGFFIIPKSGFYDLHSTLSIETHLKAGMGDVMIYSCIVTSSGITLGCNRMRQKKGWAGHSEILVLSRWLEKGERIGVTLAPKSTKSLIHGNPTENTFVIRQIR
ncbi:uncharacterized protein LOC133196888 [Saccostrea echinata]|uniref:uncharacterized protein LOC133174781 n=1 Tax=Saccostrea echinata TaxID=191078 RepID=UPI002A7F3494|nr:uncharacterized protein LOC133174781 [Saccostrea echinata]XP_061188720.1 uncharacterized protein LOC133196888 [Saccostrea echinata]